MNRLSSFSAFSALDLAAVAFFVTTYLVSGWLIERASAPRLSVSVLMADYRREWMRQFVTRTPRLFDANVIASLRQGTSFLASASMIAIGGGLALIGNRDTLGTVAEDLDLGAIEPFVWEMKMLLVLGFVTNAFLKFLWAHRLFGYCAIVMAAVPNDIRDPRAALIADQAAEVNIRAARSFNRALRSIYFALAGLAWLLGAPLLILATAVTVTMIWRREYGSQSHTALLRGAEAIRQGRPPEAPDAP